MNETASIITSFVVSLGCSLGSIFLAPGTGSTRTTLLAAAGLALAVGLAITYAPGSRRP